MEVTLQDIARELDVSAATVSRSLRHDVLIHPETRARVNEVAERLGYKTRTRRPRRVDESATKTCTLGVLLRKNSLQDAERDSNLTQMMSGIMSVIDSSGVQLQIHTVRLAAHRHMAEDPSEVPPMVERGVCNAFIVHGDQDPRDVEFLAARAPVVSMGRIFRDLPVDAAVADNAEGVFALVRHLAQLGHRQLAWVGSGVRSSFGEARQSGFIQGCLHYGLAPESQTFLGWGVTKAENLHAPDGLLAPLEKGVTGFVCENDSLAVKLVTLLETLERRVPQEISVAGFDAFGLLSDEGTSRRITSIDPHFFKIGQVAAQMAIQRVAQPLSHPCVVSVRGELRIGETTAPPPGDR